jgi:energy-coupling factor transporter transmembrane protein EcfT
MSRARTFPQRPPFGASPSGQLVVAIALVAAIATAPLGRGALSAAAFVTTVAVIAFGQARRIGRAAVPMLLMIGASIVPIAVSSSTERAGLVALRALLAATTAMAVAGATTKESLAPALGALGVPGVVAAVLASALRQTTVLRTEGRRLLLARKLRGRAGYGDGAALLGILFARAATRAERVELAMRLRGFAPEQAMERMRLGRRDAPLVAIAGAAAAAIHLAGRLTP